MGRFIGGVFGNCVPVTPGFAPPGIYSSSDQYYVKQEGGWATPSGLTATGGVISDYTSPPGDVYRAHVFTSSGIFDVQAIGGFGPAIEYLVVGGGGAGGEQHGGGGGAGGLVSNLPSYPFAQGAYGVSVGGYTVTIGAGGGAIDNAAIPGSDTNFYPTPVSHPHPSYIRGHGGGGGGSYLVSSGVGDPGGSGGGAVALDSGSSRNGGAGFAYPGPTQQGYPGGSSIAGPQGQGAGGGGAGAAGAPDNYPVTGPGGAGVQIAIAGPTATTFTGVGALNPGPGEYQWFAGGGGGGTYTGGPTSGGEGGVGGGGHGGEPTLDQTSPLMDGLGGTGGGGGGSHTGAIEGGNGGSGIVVVRYQIASLAATAKASGGAISFYGSKVIHTFTTSGEFKNTSGSTLDAEYVCVGGGGGGGGTDPNCWGAGGGGAGQYLTGNSTISAPNTPFAITIGAGGHGGVKYDALPAGQGDNTVVAFPAGTVTSYGGGRGGSNHPGGQTSGTPLDGVNHPNVPAGSGSGGGGNRAGAGGDGGPSALGAYPGGDMPGGNHYIGGGGGGAGGAGGRGSDAPGIRSAPQILTDGLGGVGKEVPATFQNPAVTFDAVHASSQWYLAGGGGGGMFNPSPQVNPDRGGKGGGGYGGGGAPGVGTGPGTGSKGGNGFTNTGGGGGGGGSFNDSTVFQGGAGGSGIVIIAYPT